MLAKVFVSGVSPSWSPSSDDCIPPDPFPWFVATHDVDSFREDDTAAWGSSGLSSRALRSSNVLLSSEFGSPDLARFTTCSISNKAFSRPLRLLHADQLKDTMWKVKVSTGECHLAHFLMPFLLPAWNTGRTHSVSSWIHLLHLFWFTDQWHLIFDRRQTKQAACFRWCDSSSSISEFIMNRGSARMSRCGVRRYGRDATFQGQQSIGIQSLWHIRRWQYKRTDEAQLACDDWKHDDDLGEREPDAQKDE